MKSIKKVLSCLLALTIVASAFVIPAGAAEDQAAEAAQVAETPEVPVETVSDAAEPDENGFVIEDGVLTGYKGDDPEIVVPDTVRKISKGAFSGKKSLITSVSIPDSVTEMDEGVFSACKKLKSVRLPSFIEKISKSTFSSCESLTSVDIPDSVKTIEAYAFKNCSNLETISFSSSLEKIEYGAFRDCSQLKTVFFSDNLKEIGAWAFYKCKNLKELYLGNKIESIDDEAFYECQSLTEINIPDSLNYISMGHEEYQDERGTTHFASKGAFYHCDNLTSIFVSKGNKSYKSIDGVLYSYDMKTLLKYPNMHASVYTIPTGVEKIGREAFATGNRYVTNFKIGNITMSGFFTNTNVESVFIPNTVTEIDNNAFENCKKLNKFDIGENVRRIGKNAFIDCVFESIVIPDSVEYIDYGAFYRAINHYEWYKVGEDTQTITIGKNVKHIGECAFSYCRLSEIIIPNNVEYLGESAFSDCENLKSVQLSENLTHIGGFAFSMCSLSSIVIPKSVDYIGVDAFKYNNSLKNAYFERAEGETVFGSLTSKSSISPREAFSKDCEIHYNTISNIALTKLPNKTKYKIKEKFDPVGGQLLVTYIDGTSRIQDMSGELVKISGYNNYNEGEQTITVSYCDRSFTFKITVGDVSEKILNSILVTAPNKTIYEIGEALDVTGGTITLIYSDKTRNTIPLTIGMCSGFDSSTAGTKTITVTYEGKTTTFKVTVSEHSEPSTDVFEIDSKEYPTIKSAIAAIVKDAKADPTNKAYTIYIPTTFNEKAVTLPKGDFTITFTGGTLTTGSITANCDVVINCDTAPAAKTINLKCAATKTITISKPGTFGTISGAKDSKLVVNAAVTAETIKTFSGIKSSAPITITKGISGVVLDDCMLSYASSLAKKIKVTSIIGKVSVDCTDKIKTGTSIFTYDGKGEFPRESVSIIDTDDEKVLEAFLYKKDVRAEIPDCLLLNGENCPSWEYALSKMNDANTDYTITLNRNLYVQKLELPAKAKSLTINGAGHGIYTEKTKVVTAKCPLTLNNIEMSLTDVINVSIKAGKFDVTLTDAYIGALTTSGKLTVNGSVGFLGAVSVGELCCNTAETYLGLHSLAVTRNGITPGSEPITLYIAKKKNGLPVEFTTDKSSNTVVKTFKLPKGGSYVEGSLLLDPACGTGILKWEKNKIILT